MRTYYVSLTEKEGRGEQGVGFKVLPHITPSLINSISALWQGDRPRYQG